MDPSSEQQPCEHYVVLMENRRARRASSAVWCSNNPDGTPAHVNDPQFKDRNMEAGGWEALAVLGPLGADKEGHALAIELITGTRGAAAKLAKAQFLSETRGVALSRQSFSRDVARLEHRPALRTRSERM